MGKTGLWFMGNQKFCMTGNRKQQRHPMNGICMIAGGVLAFILINIFSWIVLLGYGSQWMDGKKLSDLEKLVSSRESSTSSGYVHIDEMPDQLLEAFIAVEDQRYMSHHGVDLRSLGRAMWVDILAGKRVQGGSTITMQLARNLFLTHDKTFVRKMKEIIIAIHLENRFTKEQILELYLNKIYFGHGKYGIEQAANLYFNKTVRVDNSNKSTISLSEAAVLAALPKAPELYSPVKYPERSRKRQALVLNQMEKLGYITNEEKLAALTEAAEQVYIRKED